ncbi:MAG: hypothetical protein WA725_22510, partial [Pseudolabrys sp.]
TWGRSGLLTQWIIKYGYLPIILIGMVGLALDIGTREWKSDDVIVAAPVVAAPSVVAEAPVVAETFVERRPPTVEIKVEPKPTMQLTAPVMAEDLVEPPPPTMKTKVEAKPTQLAALNPHVRLPEESDQPASKGYIMYANLPTNWTPLPLPDGISSASTPHTDNIRAEIEQAAKLFDVDIQMMKAFAKIESGYNPKAKTGSYKCLFQLSNQEFAKYWQGNIYDIRDCSVAAARKFATEAAQFEKDVGRRATAAELYCIHQQGYEGCSFHYDAPQQLAWKNMYLTTEGQEKGAKWARKAIWGNVPKDLKNTFKGGVEALTSGQFIALWTERVNRFMARKVEPPTHYVQHASKAKKSTKLSATGKKKTKGAAIKNEKMTKLEAR